MSRVQLALNVAEIAPAVDFYSKLFGAEPAKVRPGYANFAIADPPLKLVLIEDTTKTPGTLNHLGVEVAGTEEVAAARERLAGAGLTTTVEDATTCCYALQDKVWAHGGPGGSAWEFYAVLGDAAGPDATLRPQEGTPCCSGEPGFSRAGATASSCC